MVIKDRKEYLDSLWIDTDVYKWLIFLSEGNHQKAMDYADKLQKDFEEKYGDNTVACGRYVFWKGREIAEKLAKELKTWNEYMEYMETFSEDMNQAMYETDIFDSFMVNNLN